MDNQSHFDWEQKLTSILTKQQLQSILVETFSSEQHLLRVQDIIQHHDPRAEVITLTHPLAVKDLREIRRSLNLRSDNSRSVLIPHADRMSREVANTLLKTLEESLAHVTFVFLAKPHAILPTIRSRCCVLFAQSQDTVQEIMTFQNASELFQKMQKHKEGNYRDVIEIFLRSIEDGLTATPLLTKKREAVLLQAFSSLQKNFISRIEAENIILQWKYV